MEKPKNFYSKGYISKLLNGEYKSLREGKYKGFPNIGVSPNKIINQELTGDSLIKQAQNNIDLNKYLQYKNTTKSIEKTIKMKGNEAQHCMEYNNIPIKKQMNVMSDNQTIEDLHGYFVQFYQKHFIHQVTQKAKVALTKIEAKGKHGDGK